LEVFEDADVKTFRISSFFSKRKENRKKEENIGEDEISFATAKQSAKR